LSADGKLLATRHPQTHTVQVWDVAAGKVVRTLSGHRAVPHGLAFSADGKRLASVDRAGMVKVWEATTGRPLLTAEEHDSRAEGLAFNPDGRQLVVVRGNGSVKGWSLT